MKQSTFKSDEHAFNDMHGRMLSEYKKAVEQYKADIASGKMKAPKFPDHVEIVPHEKPPITSTHNERKETEQARLS